MQVFFTWRQCLSVLQVISLTSGGKINSNNPLDSF